MNACVWITVEHQLRSGASIFCCALLLAACRGSDDGSASSESEAGTFSAAGMATNGGGGAGGTSSTSSTSEGTPGGAPATAGASAAGGLPSGGVASGGQQAGETSVLPGSTCGISVNMDGARLSVELSQPVQQKRVTFRLKWNSSGTPCSGEVGLYGAGRADQSVELQGFDDTATVSWEDGWLLVHQTVEEEALRDTFEVGIGVNGCNEGYESSDVRLDAGGGLGGFVVECQFE